MPEVLLPQLVDLALGTPEVGAVNFNVLHTLLHAMINKLGLGDAKADLSEVDREFLTTYNISKPAKSSPLSGSDRDNTLSGQSPARANVVSASASDRDSTRGDDSLLDESVTSEVVESKPYDFKKSTYHQLENRVAELARTLDSLNALPSTHEFLIEVKGEMPSKKRAVSDMWQSMQIKKKVETNEEGIAKVRIFYIHLICA